jgi:mRNA deadenylase 3'-5' endonuclease subunit Ccr4
VRPLPARADVAAGLPDESHPSDHLPLAADFLL